MSSLILTVISPDLTRIGTVQQSDHILGPLPQTLKEVDHEVADVLRVVGGERVLVPFDGGQREALPLEFTSSGRPRCMRETMVMSVTCTMTGLTCSVPAAGHSSDLWEGELQKDLLLLIHKVNTRPVHCHDHVILG